MAEGLPLRLIYPCASGLRHRILNQIAELNESIDPDAADKVAELRSKVSYSLQNFKFFSYSEIWRKLSAFTK